jgi:hypothetical protein
MDLLEFRGAVGRDLVGVVRAAQSDLGLLGLVIEVAPDDGRGLLDVFAMR